MNIYLMFTVYVGLIIIAYLILKLSEYIGRKIIDRKRNK